MSTQFQVVALQAVVADCSDGDTIHRALGTLAFHRTGERIGDENHKQLAISKSMLRWRWVMIDGISMVSARLLVEADMKLRT